MVDPRYWTDDEIYAAYEGGFRADTAEKRELVSRIKQRMVHFEGKTPQTDDEKVEEISAFYIAVMEESDYPARMRDLVDQGAKSFFRREDHEVDEAYERLRDEIDTMAQQYFYLKRLLLGRKFGWILFDDIKLGSYTTDHAFVTSNIRRKFCTTLRGREEIDLLPVEYTERHANANYTRAQFDEAVALGIERAKRNGW